MTTTHRLEVDTLKDGKKVVVHCEVGGNPEGVPVVYLHGGPGDSVESSMLKQFDTSKYKVICFDQRGCGQSTPRNHLEKNTTEHLLLDMEQIRETLNGGQPWVVAGGSWGSALALIYAIRYPHQTRGLLLRGAFDLRHELLQTKFYPEIAAEQEALVGAVPGTPSFLRKSMRLLTGKRTATRRKFIRLMNDPRPMFVSAAPTTHKDSFRDMETLCLLGTHYEVHDFFMPSNYISKGLPSINHIPMIIVHGRYDIICSMEIAYSIQRRHGNCDLRIVKAGHTLKEPLVLESVYRASQDMLKRLIRQTRAKATYTPSTRRSKPPR